MDSPNAPNPSSDGVETEHTHAHGHAHEHPRLHALADAAIEAEIATGIHEDTLEEARAHILWRIVRITGGFVLLALGILAIPLPGPGWLLVAAALAVLAKDFMWAERTVELVRQRIPGFNDGAIEPKTWVMVGVVTTAGIGFSFWFTLLR